MPDSRAFSLPCSTDFFDASTWTSRAPASLSSKLPVTRQAVAKHLLVLDRAGLVRSDEVGRERRFRVDERQLARAAAQLQSVGAAWDARLSRIKRIAESIQQSQKKK